MMIMFGKEWVQEVDKYGSSDSEMDMEEMLAQLEEREAKEAAEKAKREQDLSPAK